MIAANQALVSPAVNTAEGRTDWLVRMASRAGGDRPSASWIEAAGRVRFLARSHAGVSCRSPRALSKLSPAVGPARRLARTGGGRTLLHVAPGRCRRAGHQDRARRGRLRARLRHRRARACPAISSGSIAASRAWSPTSSSRPMRRCCTGSSARADVFIQNLAPGAAARAGFGSDDLRERHPRLITVDISGYGETGDYADDEGLRPAGAGGIRPGDDHRPSRRPGPRRRLGLRHRLRHGRTRRRAGGADRARHHRPRQGPQGQPVRRHGRIG